MVKVLQVRYTLQSGSLPNGMSLNPDTGVITGSAGWDALGLGPSWQSPATGSLGTYNVGDTLTSTTFQATTAKTPVTFSLVQGFFPWGVTFNPTTGALSGTIKPILQRVNEAPVTTDGPSWGTAFGTLGTFDEVATVSISMSATPLSGRTVTSYWISDGALPWGLVLNASTGVISGTTARLKTPGTYVDVPLLPIPVWTNATGSLGTFDEYTTIPTITLAATPATGRSMAKYLITSGALPFGLKLNSANGNITGTCAELKGTEDAFIDPANRPVFSDTVSIQSVNTTVTDGGSLGSYAKGTAVSAQFTATPVSGRQIRNYWISSGSLPFGLKLSSTGAISGTIDSTIRTKSGTYTFTITATDKGDTQYRMNRVSRTFTLTVQ